MSESFFRIGRGLELDDLVQLLQGAGSPGTGDSGNAPVGSAYLDNTSGEFWTKIAVGSGIDKWSKQASQTWVSNNVAGTISWREPVAVIDSATTTLPSGALAGTIDGVTLVDGARVLFSALSPASPNVYVWNATTEIFVEDVNTLSQGDTVYVDSGTQGGTRWTWNGTQWVRFDSTSLDELAYIRAFDGKQAAGSVMPVYSSTNIVVQGSSLVSGISQLDLALGAGVNTGNFISDADSLSVNLQAIDTELGQNVVNGNYILATNKINANIQALDTVIGAPIAGSHPWILESQHVNGNLIALADEIGSNVSNGNFIVASNTVNQNIQTLDFHLGAAVTTGSIIINTYSANENIQALDSKIGAVLDGNQVLASNTISANINALDTFIGADQVSGTYVLASNTVTQNIQAIDTALTEISKESTSLSVTTSTIVDSITATVVKWIVKVVDAANSDNVQAFEIFAASNGLTVDYTRFAVLKLGAAIPGLVVSANLASSNIQLLISSTGAVNVTVRRVSSI